jgi:hypothetical protein
MRTFGIIGIVFLASTGAAIAGPHGDGAVRDHRSPAPAAAVVRDHRSPAPAAPVVHERSRAGGNVVVRDHRAYSGPVVHERRGAIYASRGRYVFPGGVVRTYRAPVIRAHYYNYYRRPALIVEPFEPVPGYAWIHGDWRWSGAEWLWVPGYWAVAAAPVSVGATVVIH